VLPDGSYEGLVVDVADGDDGVTLSIVVTAGEHKGDVADVRASGMHDDALDMLGMPCVLTVASGAPSVVFD
jgi:hypothetical protein